MAGERMKILVLHGVNLNMFGRRDPEIYGKATLDDINRALLALAAELGCQLDIFQSNHEGEFIERIHMAREQDFSAVIVNAGAWTHYSYALADALAILSAPVIEVHMSNIHAREEFRHKSVLAPVVKASVAGFGVMSYLLALRGAVDLARA